jgi:purine-nucleoside phosphorylase
MAYNIMKNIQAKLQKAELYLKKYSSDKPEIAVILGSGLGGFADTAKTQKRIPYKKIPYFPCTGVEGHSGNLVFSTVSGKKVLLLEGRPHFYEGYSMEDIVFPVKLAKKIGIKYLVITAAVGSVNPNIKKGDFVVLNDYINLMGTNPLIGNYSRQEGERFIDMRAAFDKKLFDLTLKVAKANRISAYKGVYAAVTGPCYETPSEVRAFRKMGADVVGMSVVPETIVANQLKIKVLGVCSVANSHCSSYGKTSHKEVILEGKKSSGKLKKLLNGVIERI